MEEAHKVLPEIAYCQERLRLPAKAPTRAVIVTEWDEFRALDLERVEGLLAQPVIVDLRNIYRPEDMAGARLPLRQHRPGQGRRDLEQIRAPPQPLPARNDAS